jgi:membrane protease subunit (stomatin/prohibitin family)
MRQKYAIIFITNNHSTENHDMGILDKLRGEFVDIIEWTDDSNDTMVYRFDRYGNEIKYKAQLTVRESQKAVFINEGKICDVFEPGMYTLETKNLPILATLQGWKYGFESPFKAEVYFVSTRQFTNLKWGTKNPIMLRDPEFGPVRLRTFGSYCLRINDPAAFITEIAGTDGHFTTDEITAQLRNLVVSRSADILGESKIPVLDMAANYDELGAFVTERIKNEFNSYGLDITQLLIENISLPPAVEEALDKRSSMGILGNLNAFTQFQAANALEAAAENPSGTASAGVGMGMGFAMANQMGQAMFNPQQGQQPPTAPGGPGGPPPLPSAPTFFVAVDGQQTGPFTADQLKPKIADGSVNADSLVWAEGMPEWTAASKVPAVSGLFGATPPPIPPSA